MNLKDWKINTGDVFDIVQDMPDKSFDGCLHDPPYGIDFMGRQWDHGVPSAEVYAEILRVLKPGAHLLAFGSPRTYHRLAVAIEDAGFEIRDCLIWLYGSGMPKGTKLETAGAPERFEGYRTGLKPAWEPCIVAMRPVEGTFKDNAERYGVAGLNGKGCGINSNGEAIQTHGQGMQDDETTIGNNWSGEVDDSTRDYRVPSNVILDPMSSEMLDRRTKDKSRFYYSAKAHRKERDAGLDGKLEADTTDDGRDKAIDNAFQRGKTAKLNNHPCVKPLALCEYVARLILPPEHSPRHRKLFVPYSGSGSEMIGALQAGWDYVEGVEINKRWVEIADLRLKHWIEPPGSLFEFAKRGQGNG